MSLAHLTRDAVLAAIAEYDQLGRDAFLSRYGYGPAKDYFISYNGKDYDSKAIAGVAHGYLPGREPLRSDEFTGGAASVGRRLRSLGFEVPPTRAPAWSRDEVILACDLVARNDWKAFSDTAAEVIELSEMLQVLPIFPMEVRGHKFRNPAGVAHKTADIATAHPDYTGAPKKGGALDKVVLAEFMANPSKMHKLAENIREAITADSLSDQIQTPADGEQDGVVEGRLMQRVHFTRERDPKLRRRKIDSFLKKHDRVHCEACGFDFEEVYGERGAEYIEVHHVLPLHESGPTRTKLTDLVLVCANCHRMIHYGTSWLTIEELREILGSNTEG